MEPSPELLLHRLMVQEFPFGTAASERWHPPSGVALVGCGEIPRGLGYADGGPKAFAVQGDLTVLMRPTVAIVGTRGATPYGRAVAWKFSEAFARSGVCVVSGGAVGIDAEAHAAALAAGGSTVVVLPSPLDKPMPRNNLALFEQAVASGCLLSQFPLGSKAMPTWPLFRNRVIAQLSDAVLVVEVPSESGALNTARHARELGKPVFAVPGSIELRSFAGSHRLIREGLAALADDPGPIIRLVGASEGNTKKSRLTGPEALIAGQLRLGMATVDELADKTGLDMTALASALTMMELEGLVFCEGPYYVMRL